MQIQNIDPTQLKPHPDNAKIHSDKQIDRIAKSMDNTGGSIQPIVCDENFVILAGHGRWMAHKKRGDVECPVIVKTGLSDKQKKKFLLADNQTNAMTGNAFDAVSKILQELNEASMDISDIGFSEKELDKFLNFEAEEEEADVLGDASEESSTMRELKDSMLLTMDQYVGDFQLPRLSQHNLVDSIPEEFIVWMNRHRTPPLAQGQMHYHLFGRESTKGLDPENTLISFYIDDVRFERVWTKLKENTQRLLNANTWGLVMPDFSRNIDSWPLAKNLWNVYRNYYCARYWQEAGLPVIPNLSFGSLDTVEAFMAPIPEHCPVVSLQLQTMGGRAMKSGEGGKGADPDDLRAIVSVCMDLIKPETLMVYGGEPGLILGEEICKRHGVRFVGVANRATAATGLDNERGF